MDVAHYHIGQPMGKFWMSPVVTSAIKVSKKKTQVSANIHVCIYIFPLALNPSNPAHTVVYLLP